MAKEQYPSSDNLITIAKETLPAVVSIRVTKKTEQLILKTPDRNGGKSSPGETPYELFEKFFEEQMPNLFEEREMEIPAAGSGLIISSDGYIITNFHVVAEAKANTIDITLHDGRKVGGKKVKVIGTDPLSDLAVLKIDVQGLDTVPWGKSDSLQIGEWVLAMGNPFELSGSVTQGIVSAKHRIINKIVLEDLIQTTAVINPGSSGGPLVNLEGEVVGINTAIATRSGIWQGIGFAIPSNTARRVAEEIIEHGKVQQGWIGIFMRDVTPQIASFFGLEKDEGVLIMDVIKESPADKEGIQRYDIITSMNGEKVEKPLDLLQKTASKKVGEKVELKVSRLTDEGIEEVTVKLKLGSRPSQGDIVTLQEPLRLKKLFDSLGLRVYAPEDTNISGVEVIEVKPKSPAERGKLKRGDLIIEINDIEIKSLKDYKDTIKAPREGKFLIRYIRENAEDIAILKIK
jgi:serine protease Do